MAAVSKEKSDLGLMPSRFLSALTRLEEIHADLTIRQLKYLMFIAQNPGTVVADMYRALNSKSSMASHTLAVLSDVGTEKVAGLKLVEYRPDEKDRRRKRLFLTAKGARLLADLKRDLGL